MASLGHAQANAVLLSHVVRALRTRAPQQLNQLDEDLRCSPEALADDLARRAAVAGLGALGSDDELLERAVQTAAGRPELERSRPRRAPAKSVTSTERRPGTPMQDCRHDYR